MNALRICWKLLTFCCINKNNYQLQLSVDVLNDEVNRHFVLASTRNYDIGMGHRRFYVVGVRGLYHIQILFQDPVQIPAAL